ncbi:MAG: hypothetical protein DMG64_14440 [Acidobacteria bacterium]|nr:MAG: hypothetical protein DMG64_14440 [Acidobacteriota bacterium]
MSRGHFVRDHVPIHVHRCSDVNLKSVNQVGDGTQTARTPRTFTYDSLSELITAANGESGTICYGIWSSATCINGYDADGNLLHKTDARGMTVNYGYDAINRLTIKTYSDGSASREFYYDAANHGYSVGRLTHASNDVNDAFDPSYDKMGRIIGETWCIPSACDYTKSPQPCQLRQLWQPCQLRQLWRFDSEFSVFHSHTFSKRLGLLACWFLPSWNVWQRCPRDREL